MPLNKAGNTVHVLSYAAYMLIRLQRMSYCTETSHYNHFKKEIYSAYFHMCL